MQSTTNQQLFTEISAQEATYYNGGAVNVKRLANGVIQVINGLRNIWYSFS